MFVITNLYHQFSSLDFSCALNECLSTVVPEGGVNTKVLKRRASVDLISKECHCVV